MTALRKPRAGLEPRASHRTYRDPDPTHTVICKLIDNQADLLRLAAGIDRVELRQAPGAGWIPAAMTTTVVEALRAIDLVNGSADPRAERLDREMRRRLTDALARIRLRCNRHLLAGVTHIFTANGTQAVLVLAFVGPGITSCEWHLAIPA
jgi:hypothetical protein